MIRVSIIVFIAYNQSVLSSVSLENWTNGLSKLVSQPIRMIHSERLTQTLFCGRTIVGKHLLKSFFTRCFFFALEKHISIFQGYKMRRIKTLFRALKEGGILLIIQDKYKQMFFPILPPLLFEKFYMLLRLGYWPHIKNPRSWNEKIIHSMLIKTHPLAHIVADKWRVREYVEQKGLSNILNEVYWVGDNPELIPFENFPYKFVIKANHGCNWNILVSDKTSIDEKEIIEKCKEWLSMKLTMVAKCYENHYDLIPPKIIIEKFIEDDNHLQPLDYKFLCFHGKVQYIYMVERNKEGNTLTFYNKKWEKMNFGYTYPIGEFHDRPKQLNEMLDIAEKLSCDFEFVRVDLYSPNENSIIFGELTLTPGGGVCIYNPKSWDFKLGELW